MKSGLSRAEVLTSWRLSRAEGGSVASKKALAFAGIVCLLLVSAAACGTEADGVWTEVKATTLAPSARTGASMVWNPIDETALLFGGESWEYMNDLWEYDPSTGVWRELQPEGRVPPARAYHMMAVDPVAGKLVLFGGRSGDRSYQDGTWTAPSYCDDTWTYDLVAGWWSKHTFDGDSPLEREDGAMVYDSSAGKVVLFGGYRAYGGFGEDMDDTWVYDCSEDSWREMPPNGERPSARDGHAMAFDPTTGRSVLFGGSPLLWTDTWAYDYATNTWTRLHPSGDIPTERFGHRMVYNPASRSIILFGGTDFGNRHNDTWEYLPLANDWLRLRPAGGTPQGRLYAAMSVGSEDGLIVLFGGAAQSQGDLGDTWTYLRTVEPDGSE